MKRSILFGMALLTAFATQAVAQNEVTEAAAKPVKVQKKYAVRLIRGTVIDAGTGKPVEGAIVEAGGIEGYSTLTDENGKYEVKVPTFVTSAIITNPDYNLLSFGLVKEEEQKEVRLYSISFTPEYEKELDLLNNQKSTDLIYSSAYNVKEEIQNQLGAYAYSVNRNGTAGIGNVMFVQGLNSLNANAQPLVVIDGVILDQQYGREMLHSGFFNDILTSINPSDIEDITIMRNGTALYGARGANGVILINTHRSHSMATRISAKISAGVTYEPKFIETMDAEQYRSYASELLGGTNTKITDFKFLNSDPNYYYYDMYHNNTDWKEQVYRTAFTQNYGINVEGGDEVAQYNLSVGYTTAQSTMKFNDMTRMNVRFNTDIKLTDKFSVRFDASFSNTTRSLRNDGAPLSYTEGTPTSPSFLAYVKAPFLNPYSYGNGRFSTTTFDIAEESYLDEVMYYYPNYNYQLGNPSAINEYADGENKNRFENSLLNLAITPRYDFTKHLSLSEHFSYSVVNTNNKFYIPINGVPSYYVSGVSGYRTNEVRALASKQSSMQSDTRLSWNHRFNAHWLNLFGGVRINTEDYNRNAQLGYNTGSDKTPFMHKGLYDAQSNGLSDIWRTMDVYAQADYNFSGKYYLQANLTGTSSSRFGTEADGLKLFDAVWGLFPSVQASWVLTNESWLAGSNILNFLRLSAGYDVSGNDGIDNDASRSFFRSDMFMNDVSGLSFAGIGNTQIKWETTRRLNVGIETNLLNDRIHANASLFLSNTDDLLALQALGFLSGLDKNWANSGKLQNTGFDVALSGKVFASKNWSWELGASVGHYRNEIKDLGPGISSYTTEINGATILTEVGQPANRFYGYQTEGVFATSEEAANSGLYILDQNGVDKCHFGAGDMIFVSQNGDKEINEKDRVVIGDPNPDIYGNIFTTVSWKRLKLDVNFNYSWGNDVFNYMRSQLESGSRFMNQTLALTQRWQSEGQHTSIPKASFQDPMGNSRFSDRWIEDGSYLRLKNVTLSYDLPINSQYLQGLQFWIQGNNLLTLTNYLGSDPEFASSSSVIGQGIDLGNIGQGRSVLIGVKVNL